LCWKWVLNDVEERDVERIQHSWSLQLGGRVARFNSLSPARACQLPIGCVLHPFTRREKVEWVCSWHMAFCDWLPGFLSLNTLNSIISLQIYFLFFIFLPKFMIIFLSINRDLIHLIWKQKKSSFSLLLILLLSFY
jgi:hypothetical protein